MILLKIEFVTKFIPLYIFDAILIICLVYFGCKHLIEGVKEVRDKDKIKKQEELNKLNKK